MSRISKIRVAALKLVIEKGYDGFTMEELAHKVGVSRRTLFNYIKDKESAVLGSEISKEVELQFQNFAAGLPTGSLREDFKIMVMAEFNRAVGDEFFPEISQLTAQALAEDTKLRNLYYQRDSRMIQRFRQAVQAREGWKSSDPRLTPTVNIIHTQFLTAFETFMETRGGTSLTDAFHNAGAIFEDYFNDELA